MRAFTLPLADEAVDIRVTLAGVRLRMVTRWNPYHPAWELSLYDADTDTPLASTIPLVSGVDLLAEFRHLGIYGALVAFTPSAVGNADPTFDNLGFSSFLYFLTDDE